MAAWSALVLAIGALACADTHGYAGDNRLDGFNVIVAPGFPLGSAGAKKSLEDAKRVGARAVALIPFLQQAGPEDPELVRDAEMSDDELRAGIRDAHALGLAVLVKPHVTAPNSWAGAVIMTSEEAWRRWFENYRRELERIARIAAEEHAQALAVGTELSNTTSRPEWKDVIAAARNAYGGRLLYFAHNVEEAETVPFWDQLDAVGVTLYPPLGDDRDDASRRASMRAVADRLDALAARTDKSIVIGEIGLRSAQGAAARPWESVEERASAADPALQAAVIADWLAALDRPSIVGMLIWEWSTDPNAGGLADTDFTVQGKPAAHVLQCAWTQSCDDAQHAVQAR